MKLLLTIILLTFLSSAWGQYVPVPRFEVQHDMPPDLFSIKSYPSEIRPEFAGTNKEMMHFIEMRFQFTPEMLIGQTHELDAVFQVDVSETGEIVDIHDLKNRKHEIIKVNELGSKEVSTALFEELKRIFLLMPNWTPGKTKGKKVKASAVIHYKKPIVFAYGNERISDKLVYDKNGQLDRTRIYTNPQIRPLQCYDSLAYNYLMALRFDYPDELLKDSIIFGYSYDCIVDENGKAKDFVLDSRPSPFPLLDSLSLDYMEQLPKYEPASIDGIPVKSTHRVGHVIYAPYYIENGEHGMRPNRQRGRYYQTSEQGLRKHFEENFTYPDVLRQEPVFGTVYISLEAKEDGSLKFCYVLSGINPLIDERVVEVLKKSSDWTYINYDRPYLKGQAIVVAVRISERHL